MTTNISPGGVYNNGLKETYRLLMKGQCPEKAPGVPLEEVYESIGKDAFQKLKIILGPNCKEEHRILVEAICAQSNIDAVIDQSYLTGRVRFK